MDDPLELLRQSALQDMRRRFRAYAENQPFTLQESLGLLHKLKWRYVQPNAVGTVLHNGERAVFIQKEDTEEWILLVEPAEPLPVQPTPEHRSQYNADGIYIGEGDDPALHDIGPVDPVVSDESDKYVPPRIVHPVFKIAEAAGAFGRKVVLLEPKDG